MYEEQCKPGYNPPPKGEEPPKYVPPPPPPPPTNVMRERDTKPLSCRYVEDIQRLRCLCDFWSAKLRSLESKPYGWLTTMLEIANDIGEEGCVEREGAGSISKQDTP